MQASYFTSCFRDREHVQMAYNLVFGSLLVLFGSNQIMESTCVLTEQSIALLFESCPTLISHSTMATVFWHDLEDS